MEKLKVKATGPCLMIDPNGVMIDVSKSQFESGARKTFTVPDSEFWHKRVMIGQLEIVASRKTKEETPNEK